MRQNAMIALTK